MKKPCALLLLGLLTLEVLPFQARGCTLWGAAGEDAGGGTIVSKNRDWKPDHVQVLKLHRGGKYAYVGLYAEGNDASGLKQGVNEQGLSVLSASASAIPKDKRQAQTGTPGLMSTLLARYASCDQVLADQEKLFSHRKPSFLLISDRHQLILLEIGLQGRFATRVVKTGPVTHCNHYLEQSLAECNQNIGQSSATRLKRISELLRQAPKPLSLSAFADMSHDQHDGANNSLWRTGTGSCTLSSWILQSPAEGAPTLRVLMANPGRPEQVESFVLDKAFWKQPPAAVLSFHK